MASQAAIFAATIASMKRAVKRKAYDSDSDSSIEGITNRGNKLRKKARFVHEGQLVPPTGPLVYKKKIEHAGFQREIISRNPRLVDEDGYEVDSEDDDERAEAAIAAAADLDPYSGVHIEQLLAPLAAASDLPHHPTLSKPFTSKTLTELTRQAGEMVQKEKASLWKIKHLLTKLSGDSTWIPCGVVETENDFGFFTEEQDRHRASLLEKGALRDEGDHGSTGTLISDEVEQPGTLLAVDAPTGDASLELGKKNIETASIVEKDIVMIKPVDGPAHKTAENGDMSENAMSKEVSRDISVQNGAENTPEKQPELATNSAMGRDEAAKAGAADNQVQPVEEEDVEAGADDDAEVPAPHRMRTRAQAQAVSDNTPNRTRSASPEFGSEPFIHPYFLAPQSSRPDRDLGLPPNEAEETRRLLQLYIQKQEEVCRGAQKVYDGLLKADRYRQKVMKWAKAEAHVGLNRDMSDGEDWYDKEEWGLDEDLKKGQDEDEEDAATTAKKTRTRRQ